MFARILADLGPVLNAPTAEQASAAFWSIAEPLGATYMQTRAYHRPARSLTAESHLKAGGLVARVAPDSYPGSAAFQYVCIERNPLVEAIRQGLTSYRFSQFAPRKPANDDYWSALSEARIAEAVCATSYGASRRTASLHLGFDAVDVPADVADPLQAAGLLLTEKLIRFMDEAPEPAAQVVLTRRERDSMKFVAEGKTDWEIGTIFGISESTARFHVDNARRKLGGVNRAHAVARFLTEPGLE